MTVSAQQSENRVRAQARRASLERELARWLPLLIAHEDPAAFYQAFDPPAREFLYIFCGSFKVQRGLSKGSRLLANSPGYGMT